MPLNHLIYLYLDQIIDKLSNVVYDLSRILDNENKNINVNISGLEFDYNQRDKMCDELMIILGSFYINDYLENIVLIYKIINTDYIKTMSKYELLNYLIHNYSENIFSFIPYTVYKVEENNYLICNEIINKKITSLDELNEMNYNDQKINKYQEKLYRKTLGIYKEFLIKTTINDNLILLICKYINYNVLDYKIKVFIK